MKKQKRRLGTPWIVLGVVVVILILLRVGLAPLGLRLVNRELPKALRTEAALTDLSFRLLGGQVALGGLTVAQPEGFDPADPLLTLGQVVAQVELRTLTRGVLEVKQVVLEDVTLRIIRNAGGRLNLEQLGPPKDAADPAVAGRPGKGRRAPSPDEASSPPTPDVAKAPSEPGRPIHIHQLRLVNVAIHYTDLALHEQPTRVIIKDLQLDVTDLLFSNDPDLVSLLAPAVVTLTAKFDQALVAEGFLGLTARVGSVGAGVPELNAALRIVGLDLQAFAHLIPPTTLQVLGGTALDLTMDAQVAPELLDVRGVVLMAGGSRLPFVVGGTPDQPDFSKAGVLFGAWGRVTGLVTGTAGDAQRAVTTVAGTVTDAAGGVVGGAGRTLGALGRGLRDTASAAVTGDVGGAVRGVGDTVTGTAGAVGSTVTDTVRTTAGGVRDAVGDAMGQSARQEWSDAIPARWEVDWAAALEWVEAQSFPPRRPNGEPAVPLQSL